MRRAARDQLVFYQAVWESVGGKRLTLVIPAAAELAGTPYDVFVLDRSLRLKRRGTVVAGQGDKPYGMFEIKSASASLPEGYRGEWSLAIAFWPRGREFDPELPVRPVAFDVPDDSLANYVYLEPVDWREAGDEGDFDRGTGRLADVQPGEVSVRWAEEIR